MSRATLQVLTSLGVSASPVLRRSEKEPWTIRAHGPRQRTCRWHAPRDAFQKCCPTAVPNSLRSRRVIGRHLKGHVGAAPCDAEASGVRSSELIGRWTVSKRVCNSSCNDLLRTRAGCNIERADHSLGRKQGAFRTALISNRMDVSAHRIKRRTLAQAVDCTKYECMILSG